MDVSRKVTSPVCILALVLLLALGANAQYDAASLAICDPTGQAVPTLVTGSSAAPPVVYAINSLSGKTAAQLQIAGFDAFTPSSIACADFRALGYHDIAVHVRPPANSGASRTTVVVIDGKTFSARFNFTVAASLASSGGLQLAAGDVDGDGEPDLVVASGEGATAARVAVYNATSGVLRYGPFAAFDASYAAGVSLAVADIGGDGKEEIVVGQITSSPLVRVFQFSQGSGAFASVGDISALQTTAPYATAGVRVGVSAAPSKSLGAILAVPFASARADSVRVTSLLLNGDLVTINRTADVTPAELSSALSSAGAATARVLVTGSMRTYPAFDAIPVYGTRGVSMDYVNPPLKEAFVVAVDASVGGVPSSLAGAVFAAASGASARLSASVAASSQWLLILQPPFFVSPRRRYQSPYYLQFTYDNLTADFTVGARGNQSQWAADPESMWYIPSRAAKYTAWGPQPALFPPVPNVDTLPAAWLRERYLASLASLVGRATYQHHHVPVWSPSSDTWKVWNGVLAGAHSNGLDCSDFTSWGWNYGIGVYLTTKIDTQAGLSGAPAQWRPGASVAFSNVTVDVTNYDAVSAALLPGDMLYVKACPSCSISHVVTWLGYVGKCRPYVAKCPPLVIDSTGSTFADANGIIVPPGPNIRQFLKTSYYFTSLSHVTRVVQDTGLQYSGTVTATSSATPNPVATQQPPASQQPPTTTVARAVTTDGGASTTVTRAVTTAGGASTTVARAVTTAGGASTTVARAVTSTAARRPTSTNGASAPTTTAVPEAPATPGAGGSPDGRGSGNTGTQTYAQSSSSSGVSAGVAAGAAIGGVAAVALVAGGVYYVRYRRKSGSNGAGDDGRHVGIVMNAGYSDDYRSSNEALNALTEASSYVRRR